MNALFLFEARRISRHWLSYAIVIVLIIIGIFTGSQFNMKVGDGIYLNSPYTIGFVTGLLSLAIIFFAIIYAGQQLFRDFDSGFHTLLFSFLFSERAYLTARFSAYFTQSFISFTLLILGFVVGQSMRSGSEMQNFFNAWYYIYPLLIFGFLNCLLVCSVLFFISFTTRKKLLVVIGGLLLYVLYMVVLIFSNSPFMAGSLPQSPEAQQISAILDPFGISSYFFEAKDLNVLQKNNQTVPFSGILLLNRILYIALSVLLLFSTFRLFSFSGLSGKRNKKKNNIIFIPLKANTQEYKTAKLNFGNSAGFASAFSFAKTDLIYLFKSITIPAVSILLLFNTGMEMYAEIEKGIRLPQKYASSGLMAVTISENFHLLGLLIVAYFINDLYWRSQLSGFLLIEKSTYFSRNKLSGHLISSSILLFFFTGTQIAEGLIFQAVYHYFHINWYAYWGTVLFNTFPLILFSGFILLINDNIKNRFIALGISVISILLLAGPFSKKIIAFPLFRVFADYKGTYSDFNAYGVYTSSFAERLLFGLAFIYFLWVLNRFIKIGKRNIKALIPAMILLIAGIFSGSLFMQGYTPKNEDEILVKAADYEKRFKKYENLPQPDITNVKTEIHLFPSENAYKINGEYHLVNQTNQMIDRILVNFNPDLKIESAILRTAHENIKIDHDVTEIRLKTPLAPDATATLDFQLAYQWFAVNGHQSFNAIIENGSFMRISRYYPGIGYQKEREIEDENIRKQYQLGKLPSLKNPEDPAVTHKDFINLDMTISTERDQTATGTGDMTNHWTKNNRNYFRYQVNTIPFRFAVSSARYQQKSTIYKGILINILYHKTHAENVDHLIRNAKITLDYCIQNFGKYPFKSISFAEISSFTKGFAATAYPSVIFMPEDMVFHANIHADKKQDVINELAGHELSHLWWGNSQINPDDRKGAPMLTETLAMYTEMMLYKKMHGKAKMMERIKMHQQIYDSEKGLSEYQPLYKVTSENIHISYSKGAVAMVKLSELIGEDKVNAALKNFLNHQQYPKKPTTINLLTELYKISPASKKEIDRLFKI
ncbi:aminopeptidase [Elizabethkingia meningoseptica]|uniref:M1 family aminopeptidase n=1 Tax=Elizabethkingia meningoseptica TaxID=238 RepID=UPI000998F88A|nr:M1 family aminopeptidase [Elizabethkingia meningoseptica]OPC05932.1 aminopeptidase [Elizabethkingia meningoseptica]